MKNISSARVNIERKENNFMKKSQITGFKNHKDEITIL